jgi:eukaryotic-like serine/threonine-protein kinase
VYVADYATLLALDAATGAERWRVVAVNAFTIAPTVAGETVYVAADWQLLALDTPTGAERWRTPVGTSFDPPAVAGGALFLVGEGLLRVLVDPPVPAG